MLYSRSVHASSCVRYRALRRQMHPAQRYRPDAHDPSPSATQGILSLALTAHLYAPPPPPRSSPVLAAPHSLPSLCCLFVLQRVAKWRAGSRALGHDTAVAPCLHAHTSSAHPLWQVSVLHNLHRQVGVPVVASSTTEVGTSHRHC